jgi:hypothetical protein
MFIRDDKPFDAGRSTIVTVHRKKANTVVLQWKTVQNQWVLGCHQYLLWFIALKKPTTNGRHQMTRHKRIQAMVRIIQRKETRGGGVQTKDGDKEKVKRPFIDLADKKQGKKSILCSEKSVKKSEHWPAAVRVTVVLL